MSDPPADRDPEASADRDSAASRDRDADPGADVAAGDRPFELAVDSGPAAGTREAPDPDDVDDLPTVSCERCGRTWTLAYELEDLAVGNQAVEQFALDHQRHTGHFPDGVATHRAVCRRCPESVQRLSPDAARRWAEVHARHTRHAVELRHADGDEPTVIGPSPEE